MKFGQLIEYKMRNIFFFERSYTKCGREASSRSFCKKTKIEHASWNVWNVVNVVFIVCPSWGLTKYANTKGVAHLL